MITALQQARFTLSRWVRQGDPLSPYLFIIALETLAIKIRTDDSIKGFSIGGNYETFLCADDMTNLAPGNGKMRDPGNEVVT